MNVDGVNQPAHATSATSLTFVTRAHMAGSVGVTVQTAVGTSTPALPFIYDPATGLDAAAVTVLANVGIDTSLVPSNFSVMAGSGAAGSTSIAPLLGGFLSVSISVPVAAGAGSVNYLLAPEVAGRYSPVTGGLIPCATITSTQTGAGIYHPLAPYRVLDTRHGPSRPVGRGGILQVRVRGVGGVPALGQPLGKGVATVMLNLTTTNSAQAGFFTVYPGGTRANTSTINFTRRVHHREPGGRNGGH